MTSPHHQYFDAKIPDAAQYRLYWGTGMRYLSCVMFNSLNQQRILFAKYLADNMVVL